MNTGSLFSPGFLSRIILPHAWNYLNGCYSSTHPALKRNSALGSAWVAQMVKCWTLDFGLGDDLSVHEIEPHTGLCTGSVEPAWDSLSLSYSLSLSAPPLLAFSLSFHLSK